MTKTNIFNKIKAVAFDCDGVMFDTLNVNKMYYNTMLEHFNRPLLTDEQFKKVHMYSAFNSIKLLFGDDEKTLNKAFEFQQNIDYNSLLKHMTEEPYLKPLLAELKKRYNIGIATNRSNTMTMILDDFNLTEYFDIVVTTVNVKNPKPHPEQLYKILNFFNIEPDELIFIGDSQTDAMAAQSADVPLIAYNNPDATSAILHISSLKEILDLLI